jgi:hypothetical protein
MIVHDAEMIEVTALWDSAVEGTGRPLVIFNGELDRMRNNYYPPLLYRKLARVSKHFMPKVRGAAGGTRRSCQLETALAESCA